MKGSGLRGLLVEVDALEQLELLDLRGLGVVERDEASVAQIVAELERRVTRVLVSL